MDALQHERIISSAQFQRGSLVAALIPAAQHKTRRRDVAGSEEAARTLDYGGYLIAILPRNPVRRRTGRLAQEGRRLPCAIVVWGLPMPMRGTDQTVRQ